MRLSCTRCPESNPPLAAACGGCGRRLWKDRVVDLLLVAGLAVCAALYRRLVP
ncbi:MAG TPA: hypothetical protein VMV60_01940 [Thermoanaerobaculia bacterium]|nr:hypothetical protein [Thermoanaerobaculia bacterium]